MKIYTKKGDKGETSLLGGTRLSKDHIRIDAYGSVDELNAHVGLLKSEPGMAVHAEVLTDIQNMLFSIGSHLALDPDAKKVKLPELDKGGIVRLEVGIDVMEESLPELRTFVLPGGSKEAAQAHVCRCVCRRAERRTVGLSENQEVHEIIIPYLNRLSDYFFVLSRKILSEQGLEDVPWKP